MPWAEDIQQICFVREPIKGLVELTFYVENPETVRKLEEMDLSPDGGQIIITRRFNGNRSVSRINGETVTLGRLKEASQVLIDIHGQHEHQSLLYKKIIWQFWMHLQKKPENGRKSGGFIQGIPPAGKRT